MRDFNTRDFRPRYQVNCEEPVLLLHPQFYRYSKMSRYFVTPNGRRNISSSCRESIYNGHNPFVPALYEFRKKLKNLSVNDRSTFNNFLLDYYMESDRGDKYPIFLLVPCQKCDICVNKKTSEWSDRCLLESEAHEDLPLFITLTYDDITCPLDGVDVRHCQLFFKNLRKRLRRLGHRRVRYILCAEYGTKFHRPHYHIVLWGLKITSEFDTPANKIANERKRFADICDIIGYHGDVVYVPFDKSGKQYHFRTDPNTGFDPDHLKDYTPYAWKHGHVDVQQCVDANASKYVCKYLHKKKFRPYYLDPNTGEVDYLNKTFMLCSRGNGGIGMPFFRTVLDNVRRFPKASTFCFPSCHDGKVHDIFLSSYLCRKAFPTLDQSIDVKFRNLLSEIEYENNEILRKGNIDMPGFDISANYSLPNDSPYQFACRKTSPFDIFNRACFGVDFRDTVLPKLVHEYNMLWYKEVQPNFDLYVELDAKSQMRRSLENLRYTDVESYASTVREHNKRQRSIYDKLN